MFSAKNTFKQLQFSLSANMTGLVTLFYKLTYRPRRGTVSEFISAFAQEHSNVTFLQVGANDGFFHDPLHKFIRMYGWKGVMLEPQPDVYRNYLQKLHRNTPGVHTVNAALASSDGASKMYKIAFSNLRWATGLTSFNRSALEEAIDSGHVARLAARYGEALPSKREDYIDSLEIQSISPQTLMNKYGLRKIDWVQIDAEGFDFEIIKMLSIDKLQPKVIVYEKSHLSSHDQQACLSLLHGNDYVTSQISENTIALKRPVGVLGRFFPDA